MTISRVSQTHVSVFKATITMPVKMSVRESNHQLASLTAVRSVTSFMPHNRVEDATADLSLKKLVPLCTVKKKFVC